MECGPQNCPIIDKKAHRKERAKRLYEQGFSMEAIAAVLGVSHQTIGRDLGDLSTMDNSKHAKTTTNPKGSGRRKGNRRPKDPKKQARDEELNLRLNGGASAKELAAEHGVVERTVTRARQDEDLRQEGEQREREKVDRANLSMTAQEKLDAAIRQHKKKLDQEFENRVLAECKERLNSISLPHYAKELERMERLITSRRGVMDKPTYNKIRWCLHSDHVQDPMMKRRYDDAFTIFNDLEKLLLSEKDSPTPFRLLPRTYADLMTMRAKVMADRSAAAKARAAGRTKVSVQ